MYVGIIINIILPNLAEIFLTVDGRASIIENQDWRHRRNSIDC